MQVFGASAGIVLDKLGRPSPCRAPHSPSDRMSYNILAWSPLYHRPPCMLGRPEVSGSLCFTPNVHVGPSPPSSLCLNVTSSGTLSQTSQFQVATFIPTIVRACNIPSAEYLPPSCLLLTVFDVLTSLFIFCTAALFQRKTESLKSRTLFCCVFF